MKKKEYYDNGQLKSETNYEGNQLHGFSTTYYENGQIQNNKAYSEGLLSGGFDEYYENGQLKIRANYLNDILEGEFLEYYENSFLKKQALYQNGVRIGEFKEFYDNGNIEQELTFKNGKFDGLIKRYNRDRSLKTEINYKEDVKDGLEVIYSIDEIRRFTFSQNELIKFELEWFGSEGNGGLILEPDTTTKNYVSKFIEEGKIIREILIKPFKITKETFENIDNFLDNLKNELIYLVSEFYPNGNLKSDALVAFVDSPGDCREFFEDGTLKKEGLLIAIESGDEITVKDFVTLVNYPSGKPQEKYTYDDKWDYKLSRYFENEKLSSTQAYISGKEDGCSTFYHENGKIAEKKNFKNGVMHGERVTYYENGMPWKKMNYKDSQVDGISISYSPEGKVEEKNTYRNGVLQIDGEFFIDGELIVIDKIPLSYSHFIKNLKMINFNKEYNELRDLHNFHKKGFAIGQEILTDYIATAVMTLNSFGKTGVTHSNFLTTTESKKIYDIWYNAFKRVDEKYLQIVAPQRSGQLSNERDAEYRSYWAGGGFGVKNAIKGVAMAEALNFGTNLLFSTASIVSEMAGNYKINKQVSDLYESSETYKVLTNALTSGETLVFKRFFQELGFDIEPQEVFDLPRKTTSLTQKELESLDTLGKKNRILEELKKNPYDKEIYRLWLMNFPVKEKNLYELGKLFYVDIAPITRKILMDYAQGLGLITEEYKRIERDKLENLKQLFNQRKTDLDYHADFDKTLDLINKNIEQSEKEYRQIDELVEGLNFSDSFFLYMMKSSVLSDHNIQYDMLKRNNFTVNSSNIATLSRVKDSRISVALFDQLIKAPNENIKKEYDSLKSSEKEFFVSILRKSDNKKAHSLLELLNPKINLLDDNIDELIKIPKEILKKEYYALTPSDREKFFHKIKGSKSENAYNLAELIDPSMNKVDADYFDQILETPKENIKEFYDTLSSSDKEQFIYNLKESKNEKANNLSEFLLKPSIEKKISKNTKMISKRKYIMLSILLGVLGGHKFYAGKKIQGIIYIIGLFTFPFIPIALVIFDWISISGVKANKDGMIDCVSIR